MVKWLDYSLAKKQAPHAEKLIKHMNIWDSHAHIGVDKDGHLMTSSFLLKEMDAANINKALVLPLNELDDPQFHRANNRIKASCDENTGRLLPFFRINPKAKWKKEFNLRVKQNFKGIKVHPLSQNFTLSNKSFRSLCKSTSNAGLPMLIHLGFGVNNIVENMYEIVTKYPDLKIILGHAAFPDLKRMLKDVEPFDNVLFETSTLRIFDLFELLQNASYKKIAFGSDTPYYDMNVSLVSLLDSALLTGKSKTQMEAIFGGNIRRWMR